MPPDFNAVSSRYVEFITRLSPKAELRKLRLCAKIGTVARFILRPELVDETLSQLPVASCSLCLDV